MAKKRKHAFTDTVPPNPAAAAGTAAAGAQQAAGGISKSTAAKKPRTPSHQHTDVAPTGLGQQLSSVPGRLSKEPLPSLSSSQAAAKWAPPAAAPSSCPHNPTAAVDLELARCAALEQLRHKLASLAAKAGLRNVPLLAFERWRFAAKWAEDEPQLATAAAGGGGVDGTDGTPATGSHQGDQQQQQKQQQKQKQKQKQAANDPVIPFGSLAVAPEPGLVSDLVRAGMEAEAAVGVATQLAAAAAGAAAVLVKKRQQLASGKVPGCGALQVEFHKHSLDLTCWGMFVKISRPAYGKLARLYRQHWMDRVPAAAAAAAGQPCTVGLSLEQAAAHLAALKAATGSAAAAAAAAAVAGRAADTHQNKKRKLTSAAAAAAGGVDAEGVLDGDDSGSDSDGCVAAAGGTAGRQHGGVVSGAKSKQELDAEASIAELEQQQQGSGGAAGAGAEGAGVAASAAAATLAPSVARGEFHARLFALLLRYKGIQGHGFQGALSLGHDDGQATPLGHNPFIKHMWLWTG